MLAPAFEVLNSDFVNVNITGGTNILACTSTGSCLQNLRGFATTAVATTADVNKTKEFEVLPCLK